MTSKPIVSMDILSLSIPLNGNDGNDGSNEIN